MVPFVADRSLWQTPHAARRMVTSPWRGGSTSISSTATALPTVRATTALAHRFIFCYLAWQVPAQERCAAGKRALLGSGCAWQMVTQSALHMKHGLRIPGSGSQIKYLTTSFGFEPQTTCAACTDRTACGRDELIQGLPERRPRGLRSRGCKEEDCCA